MLYATAWQTVGPYLAIGMTWLNRDDLASDRAPGERIVVAGTLRDGNRRPVDDGLIEVWQADAHGRYESSDDFRGFGRVPTDGEGRFRFRTIKPGRVPAAGGGMQAPHINVSVFARGILKRLVTRIYFAGESSNAEDPVLALVPAARRATLIAPREGDAYRFDIAIQGDGETVFFDI